MSDSFWAQPPKKDGRYVRRLLFEETSSIRAFVVAHRKAQEKNIKNLYEQANLLWTELASFKDRLEGEIEEIEELARPEAARILGRVIDTLETYALFDIEALESPGPISNFATAKIRNFSETRKERYRRYA